MGKKEEVRIIRFAILNVKLSNEKWKTTKWRTCHIQLRRCSFCFCRHLIFWKFHFLFRSLIIDMFCMEGKLHPTRFKRGL